ncbi:hypothetical protein E6O75_ATG05373 [Venturia nashicola]|uniref:Uncharacterized protein n=1 Tax=Venturia nashicola TaxID=86259 RepID=A0A4Z1P2S6_9PEZI|nr:hypothetical protein E6O75_ATG05373 [Venturia nashicola]
MYTIAAFKGAWVLPPLTLFRLPICSRCIVRSTTQQKRTITSSLPSRTSSRRPNPPSPRSFASKQLRNASSDVNDARVRSRQGATLEQLTRNAALVTPFAIASRLPKSGLVLYQAPPQRRYTIMGWVAGTIFLITGLNTIFLREWSPSVLPWTTLLLNGIVVVFTFGAALIPISSTLGLCRRITAIPGPKGGHDMKLRVEGSYYWAPWKTRIVKANVEDIILRRNMVACVASLRKPGPRLAMHQVSPFIRPFAKFGSVVASYLTEIPGVLIRQTHVSMLIRKENALDSVTFRLDARGKMFGGPRGFDRLIQSEI